MNACLVDRVEVLVVEVSKEPEHSGTKDLSEKHHERGEVKDEDHPCQPVKEHHSTYGGGVWKFNFAARIFDMYTVPVALSRLSCLFFILEPNKVWEKERERGEMAILIIIVTQKTHKWADVNPPSTHEREDASLHY